MSSFSFAVQDAGRDFLEMSGHGTESLHDKMHHAKEHLVIYLSSSFSSFRATKSCSVSEALKRYDNRKFFGSQPRLRTRRISSRERKVFSPDFEVICPRSSSPTLTPASPRPRGPLPTFFIGIGSISVKLRSFPSFDLSTRVHTRCDLRGARPAPRVISHHLLGEFATGPGPVRDRRRRPHLPHPRPSPVEVDFGDQ